MSELIPFAQRQLGNDTIPTVDARDLYDFLAPKSRFNDWIIRRIQQYGFEEGRDFTVLKNEYEPVYGSISPQVDYFLSLGMSKELSMVERTKKGKEARQYFLACEEQLKIQQAQVPAVVNPEHQLMIDMVIRIDQNEQRAIRAEAKADMALNTQLFFTVAEYVYIEKLQRQLPESAYKAASDHLRIYCIDQHIPVRKQLVGGKQWNDEYAFHVSVYTAAFTPWLYRRNAQANLRIIKDNPHGTA